MWLLAQNDGFPLIFTLLSLVLLLIPVVNIVAAVVVSIDLAKSFGKSELYGIGIWLLGFVFVPMLGYGGDRYVGPAALGP